MKNNTGNPPSTASEFWNSRFAAAEYVYGKEPNAYFKSVIDKLKPGRIFIPGAGEGRDAVYAATLGWDVYCADLSEAGRSKALALAEEKKVSITYQVSNIVDVSFHPGHFDAIASIFFHLPTPVRKVFYAGAQQWLKPGGVLILEAFTLRQLAFDSGGPKDPDMLVSSGKLTEELQGFEFINLKEHEIQLNEGSFHHGLASVVDLTARKL